MLNEEDLFLEIRDISLLDIECDDARLHRSLRERDENDSCWNQVSVAARWEKKDTRLTGRQ